MNTASRAVKLSELPTIVRTRGAELPSDVELKSVEMTEVKVDRQRRRIEGWAARYGNTDAGFDRILPGAGAKTIAERMPKKLIKVFENHVKGIGMPVDLAEHESGLLTVSEIHESFEQVIGLVEMGVFKHMSIGYSPVKVGFIEEDDKQIREIHEYKLFEYSIVYWPMNELAEITAVKTAQIMRGVDAAGRSLKDLELAHALLASESLSSAHERDIRSIVDSITEISVDIQKTLELEKEQPDLESGTTAEGEPSTEAAQKHDEEVVTALQDLRAAVKRAVSA